MPKYYDNNGKQVARKHWAMCYLIQDDGSLWRWYRKGRFYLVPADNQPDWFKEKR